MSVIDLLQTSPLIFTVLIGILGLLVGSFLNVVIARLPVMLEREWQAQCDENIDRSEQSTFNLMTPRSCCPHCGHMISAIENIPVISFLFLAGKCRECKNAISLRYPFTELLTCILSVVVAMQFGFSWQAAAALLLTWSLIALSGIDFDHQLLPDNITLPVCWAGILINIPGVFTDLQASVIGAAAGYLSLWMVYHVFKLITGKEGMGYGDFKLLALLGAWMGWQMLPFIIIKQLVGIMLTPDHCANERVMVFETGSWSLETGLGGCTVPCHIPATPDKNSAHCMAAASLESFL